MFFKNLSKEKDLINRELAVYRQEQFDHHSPTEAVDSFDEIHKDMKNRNIEHKDHWATPPDFYKKVK